MNAQDRRRTPTPSMMMNHQRIMIKMPDSESLNSPTSGLNLEHLTEDERDAILSVIKRDERVRKAEQKRLHKLKREIHILRQRSALKDGDDSESMCVRCKSPLGKVWQSGDRCPACQHKVCNNCRYTGEGVPEGSWLCNLCAKQLQYKLAANEQFYPKKEPPPTEVVRRELERKSSQYSPTDGILVIGNGGKVNDDPHGRGRHGSSISSISSHSYSRTESDDGVALNGGLGVVSQDSIWSSTDQYGQVTVKGEVMLALEYNYRTSVLYVMVHECKDLAIADVKKRVTNPYVKSYLLPDRSRKSRRKTTVKRNTVSPVYRMPLKYPIAVEDLKSRQLEISVWHDDKLGHNVFLGETTVNLEQHSFDDPTANWYLLHDRPITFEPEPILACQGHITMALKFITADNLDTVPDGSKTSKSNQMTQQSRGQLQVNIVNCRNLTGCKVNGTSDPYCKAYLLPEPKPRSTKQKTAVIKGNCNPEWDCLFSYDDVSHEELSERCLEVTVWDYAFLSNNDFLGGIRLNVGSQMSFNQKVDFMDAFASERNIWSAMLRNPNQWIKAEMKLRPNMKQARPSSIAY